MSTTRQRLIALGKIRPGMGQTSVRQALIAKGVVRPTGLTPPAAMRALLVSWAGR